MADHDDAFERAARKASLIERAQEMGTDRWMFRPFLAMQVAWGIVFAIHGWIAGWDGVLFAGHVVAFTFGLGFTSLMFCVTRSDLGWVVLSPVAGWFPLVALHFWWADGTGLALQLHVLAWGLTTAVLLMAALFAGGGHDHAPRRAGFRIFRRG